MPSFIHPSDNFERPSRPTPANGAPLSVRDTFWHAVLAHRGIANGADLGEIHACDCLAANQKPAVGVGDGERIAAIAVACEEISLEIHAPKLIRRRHHRERLRTRRSAPLLPPRVGEPGTAEDLTYRTCRRPARVRVHAFQSCLELPRPPGREPLPQRKDLVLYLCSSCMGAAVWFSCDVQQTLWANFVVAVDPLVRSRTRNAVLMAEIGYRHFLFQIARQKL